MDNDYSTWAVIVGFLIFAAVWVYAIIQWGLLIGLMIGWIPAIIAGVIGGILWPIVLLVVLFLYLMFR
jgi:hypothetical protein